MCETLSEKEKGAFGIEHYMKEDVKEFIKEVKEIPVKSYDYRRFCHELDLLAGKELLE